MKKSFKILFALVLALVVAFTSSVPNTVEAAAAKPAKVTIKSVSRSTNNKTITIKYKKVSKATGYQIAYKKTSAKKYSIKTTKKTTCKLSVKANASYKIKVRAYRKSGKKTVYGNWVTLSTIKKLPKNHKHNWVKVVDRAAYDEPIYTEKPVYEERPVYETQTTYVDRWTWPDGSDGSALANPARKAEWCAWHCTRCFPDCPDPDPRGYCALQVKYSCEEVTTQVQTGTEKVQVGTEKVQTGTKHHDEEYHYECTCGARK